jgi:hypothetical protein
MITMSSHGCPAAPTPMLVTQWVEYNKRWRFGNALFIDGECVATGYLSPEHVTKYSAEEKKAAEDVAMDDINVTCIES